MTKRTDETPPVNQRKQPKQRRSAETVEVIIEAAARLLETRGFEGFNTNAIAGNAGVSVGSLYQYFPGKQAILSALIDREMSPLLEVAREIEQQTHFKAALQCYIRASVRNQLRRPELARLIDLAEKREMFEAQVAGTSSQLRAIMQRVLAMKDAPKIQVSKAQRRSDVASDLTAIIRALVDAAGECGEAHSQRLEAVVEGAIMGYLGARIHPE